MLGQGRIFIAHILPGVMLNLMKSRRRRRTRGRWLESKSLSGTIGRRSSVPLMGEGSAEGLIEEKFGIFRTRKMRWTAIV